MKRFVVLALLVIAPIASAQQNPDWLKHAAFYQIYPSSYQDSDGNGIGDIAGIWYPRRDQERDHRQDRGTDASGLSRPPTPSDWDKAHPGSPLS